MAYSLGPTTVSAEPRAGQHLRLQLKPEANHASHSFCYLSPVADKAISKPSPIPTQEQTKDTQTFSPPLLKTLKA